MLSFLASLLLAVQAGLCHALVTSSSENINARSIAVNTRINYRTSGFPNLFAADRARAKILRSGQLGQGAHSGKQKRVSELAIQNSLVE